MAGVGDEDHILNLHAEAVAGFKDQRFNSNYHAGLERLAGGGPEIGVFMQMETDTVANKGNRRQLQRSDLAEIEIVNCPCVGLGLDGFKQ